MNTSALTSCSSIAATILISVFMYTGLTKLIGYNSFHEALSNQPLTPAVIQHLHWAIPTTLLFSTLLLVSEKYRLYGYLFSALLLSAFTTYIVLILAHYFSYVPCSCAGIAESLSWKQHFIINLMLLSMAIIGFYLEFQQKTNMNSKS